MFTMARLLANFWSYCTFRVKALYIFYVIMWKAKYIKWAAILWLDSWTKKYIAWSTSSFQLTSLCHAVLSVASDSRGRLTPDVVFCCCCWSQGLKVLIYVILIFLSVQNCVQKKCFSLSSPINKAFICWIDNRINEHALLRACVLWLLSV